MMGLSRRLRISAKQGRMPFKPVASEEKLQFQTLILQYHYRLSSSERIFS
jgi:hypothetical protein